MHKFPVFIVTLANGCKVFFADECAAYALYLKSGIAYKVRWQ